MFAQSDMLTVMRGKNIVSQQQSNTPDDVWIFKMWNICGVLEETEMPTRSGKHVNVEAEDLGILEISAYGEKTLYLT